MTQIATDLRQTRESAKRIRYEPTAPFTATNVQDAIVQSASVPTVIVPTAVTVAMSPYTPLSTDQLLMVDTSGGPVTIQMPLSATRGLDLEIKDATGNAAANPISVLRAGAETIDGLTTYPIDSNFAAAKLGLKTGGYFIHA